MKYQLFYKLTLYLLDFHGNMFNIYVNSKTTHWIISEQSIHRTKFQVLYQEKN